MSTNESGGEKNELYVPTRAKWRAWLRANHAKADEVWLVFYKKSTGRPSLDYGEAVEEAVCFGWIDGIRKRLDDERYASRFTPRRAGSKWSPSNRKRALAMIKRKKMTAAGLRAFERGRPYDEEDLAAREVEALRLPPEMERALKKSRKAWANFRNLAPGYRRQYVGWLTSAKRDGTRRRRLKEAIELLEANRKLGMK